MTESSPTLLLIFIFIHPASIFYVNGSSELVLHFEQRTVEWLELARSSVSRSPNSYKTPEERSKLCYYAYVRANLAYIDYNHVPEWQECLMPGCLSTPQSSSPEPGQELFMWAMYCWTLPTIYLLYSDAEGSLQIIFLQTPSDLYSFDEEIVHAHSASITHDVNEWEYLALHQEEMKLTYYSNGENGRRSLCARARDHIAVAFLGKDVPAAHLHKFGLLNNTSNEYIVTMAIACPTSPKIYLCHGSAEKRIKIISVKSGIDRYEFELDDANPTSVVESQWSWKPYMGRKHTRANKNPLTQVHSEDELSLSRLNLDDRKKLCKIARRYHVALRVPYVEDGYMKKALLHDFQYSEGKLERVIAIKCSELPRIYLHLDSLEDRRVKIRVTLPENPMNHYVHHVQATGLLHQRDYELLDKHQGQEIALHPFLKMSRHDLWSYCLAAQTYLLGDGGTNWNFLFAERENVVTANKILLIPKYLKVTPMYGPIFRDDVEDVDLFIICSEWPVLYIRLGKSPKEIISVLYQGDLVKAKDGQMQVD